MQAGALIGARAVLTRDALPWTIYQGLPAHPFGQRSLDMSDHAIAEHPQTAES
jgi:acetyltransferase-like isoleucine patch superfamily enzyme